MSHGLCSSIPCSSPSRGPRLGLVVVALAVAFYCTEHNLFVSRQEDYGAKQEVLEVKVAGGKLSNQVGFSLVALVGVLLFVRRGGRPWQIHDLLAVLPLLFIGWCLATALWSADPGQTTKRVGIMTMCFIGAVGVARQLRSPDLCVLVLAVTTAYAVVGLGAELALGTMEPFSPEYRFAGTLHPNGQGANCALLCLSAACLLGTVKQRRSLWLALFVLGIALLLLTRSRTSCAAMLGGLLALRCVRPSAGEVRAALVAICALALLFPLLYLVDLDVKDTFNVIFLGRLEDVGTLTGRTELWEELLPYAKERLVQGHGYGSFWSPARVEEVSSTVYWGLSSAHSSYLETILAVGLVGAGILVLVGMISLIRAAHMYRATGEANLGLTFALLVYGILEGVAESNLIAPSFTTFAAGCGVAQLAYFSAAPPIGVRKQESGARSQTHRLAVLSDSWLLTPGEGREDRRT